MFFCLIVDCHIFLLHGQRSVLSPKARRTTDVCYEGSIQYGEWISWFIIWDDKTSTIRFSEFIGWCEGLVGWWMLNTTLNGRGRGIHSLPLVLPHSNDRMTGWPNSNGVCFEKYCALHIFKSKFQQSFPFKLQSCVDSLRNEKWRGFWTWKRTIRTLPLTNSGVIHGEQEGAMNPWIGDSDFGIKVLMVTHFLPRCLILLTWLLGVTNCMASEQTLLHHKVLKIASVADAHSSKMLRTKALDTLITTPTSTTLPKELGGGRLGIQWMLAN